MLEEFRRRKNLESYREKLYEKKREKFDEDPNEMPKYEPDPYLHLKKGSGPPSRYFGPSGNEIFNTADFTLLFMESDSTTLVTKLNRINHRRVLAFIGNAGGVISYGKGKGIDYQSAFQNCYIELKKNLICIDLDPMITLTAPLYTRFNDFRLWLYPRASPNYWGSMKMMHLLIYTGIYHVRFVIKSRKNDNYSMLYAFFELMATIKKPSDFAKLTGMKTHALTYNSPLGSSLMVGEVAQFAKEQAPR